MIKLLVQLFAVISIIVIIHSFDPNFSFLRTIKTTNNSPAQVLGKETAQDPLQPFLDQVSKMTLKEKVRQVLICGYHGTDIAAALMKSGICGNFLLFAENVSGLSKNQVKANNQAAHYNDPLTWMMVDQEGGNITRIKDNSPSPRKMAETDTVTTWGQSHGKMLKDLNFDVNLAPVTDITSNSPVIKNRSFADAPEDVSNFAVKYLSALQDNGIVGVLKHLPGHGRVLVDTHSQTGKLNYSWDEVKRVDLLPFIDAINNGAHTVLVGHIIIPELDTKPASVSPVIIKNLREFLPHGSELIFITDSLIMKGVGLSMDKSPIEALKAGEDMLIINGFAEHDTFDSIIDAYNDEYLDINQLNTSVARILRVKSLFNHLN